MKKLWYLFLSLFLAFGIVACEDKGDIAPEPGPDGPTGPTAAPTSVVTDIAFERTGYQAVELSWIEPEEEYPITSYSIIAKSEGAEDLKFAFEADELDIVNGKRVAPIDGLEKTTYNVTILAGNSYGLQKNGAQFSGVVPFTLEAINLPTVAIIEQSGAMYLRFANVNGVRHIFDHLTLAMKDSSGNTVFEGEVKASDDDLAAALDDKQAHNDPIDVLIELEEGVTLDDTDTYSVEYTLYAHPAFGGVAEEGVITYEEVLDMQGEPASVEGTAEGLGVGVEVQPLFFHFYSFGSAYLESLNTAVITVPQIYEKESEDAKPTAKYHTYKIYVGSCEADSQLYVDANGQEGVYTHDDSRWYDVEPLNPDAITELNPNSDKQKNLYRDIWAGQAIKTIDLVHKQYPSYVRVEAYDSYGRMVAMGHRLCATFSVQASQPDIQAHQPKFELLPNNDGLTFTLRASHLSAARAYAKTVKWSIKDESGEIVAEDMVEGGTYYQDGEYPRHCATLINKDWKIDARNFVAGGKYTVDYEIEYIPVYTIPNMDDQQPLDYNPETGKFIATASGKVADATGLDHDVRILRDYQRDEQGNVMFRTRAKETVDGQEVTVYAFRHESGDYRGWVAWPHTTVTLTSEDMVAAGATLQNEVTAPEDNGEAEAYKMNVEIKAVKKLNTINVAWNAFSAEDITKVVINDGTKDFEVTEGGEYAWTVTDGRASVEIEGIYGIEPLVTVKVYAGEKLLDEAKELVSIFSLDNWEAPEFEWQRQSDGKKYRFIARNLMNVNYGFSNNIYEDVAGSEKRTSNIKIYNTKNNQLMYTLTATPRRDWESLDWAAYGRWAMNEQDSWKQWKWAGGYPTAEPVEDINLPLLPEGTYRVEYEFGYVVNKEGFWSTSDYPYTKVDYRPDVTQHAKACAAFPQTSPGLPEQLKDHKQLQEHVLYCDNRLQMEAGHAGDDNVGYRKLVKVFVKTGETTLYVGSATKPEIFLSAAIDEGKADIVSGHPWNGKAPNANSVGGLYESVNLSWVIDNCEYGKDYDKVVISYNGKKVEITDGSTSTVINDIKTPSVTFDVALYKGASKITSKSITTGVYTLEPAKNQVDFSIKSKDGKYWILVDQGLSGKDWFFHDLSFNVYEKEDTGFANPIFSKNVTKNGDGSLNPTINAWASFGRASYFGVDNSDYDDGCTPEYKKEKITIDGKEMGGYFSGLLPGTDYVIKYRLRAYPQIFSHTATGGEHFFKSILYDDSMLEHAIEGTVDITTPGVKPTGGAAALNPMATVGPAQYQAATVSWKKVDGATGYEIWAGGKMVAMADAGATSVEVSDLNDDSIYEFTIKAVGTGLEATTPKVSIFTMYHWTEPTFAFNGQRMVVSGLANLDKAGGSGYAYGGAITNDNDSSKSTIEIYKDGKLLYTLTNGTGQGTLTAWAGYGRWALGAQDNRKDWIWTNTANEIISVNPDKEDQKEWDVPAGTLPAGTYTLKWIIGYVVDKNANWATSAGDPVVYTIQDKRDGASCIYHGPKDTKPSPNVLYTSDDKDAVRIFTKSGETTLTVQ